MSKETWFTKTEEVFQELVPDSNSPSLYGNLRESVESALNLEDAESNSAHDISFHLSDWHREARFLVALQLFPDRFTLEEISAGITAFLVHAPNHIVAAAKLHGFPAKDIFKN